MNTTTEDNSPSIYAFTGIYKMFLNNYLSKNLQEKLMVLMLLNSFFLGNFDL